MVVLGLTLCSVLLVNYSSSNISSIFLTCAVLKKGHQPSLDVAANKRIGAGFDILEEQRKYTTLSTEDNLYSLRKKKRKVKIEE